MNVKQNIFISYSYQTGKSLLKMSPMMLERRLSGFSTSLKGTHAWFPAPMSGAS